ncbi:MAG: hypothetical protein D6796_05385, partial [Caldilineae bacterium]
MRNSAIESPAAAGRFTREAIITYLIMLVGLGLLLYGLVNLNNWRLINPQAIAEARVAKEEGLTKAEELSLYHRQFALAAETKNRFGRMGLIYAVLGAAVMWLSRRWQEWRKLFGEQMLYVYAFLLPPVGWILYLFAYRTRGDHNRIVIRRNIGIMSLSLVAGFVAYYAVLLLQAYVLSPLGNSLASSNLVVGIFNFFLAPQIAYFAGIFAGAYVA